MARIRPFSNSCKPSIVVPPGLVTWSLSAPGCWPVSKTIFAAPKTVCAASFVANVARQTGRHAAVAQRFDELINISRTAAAQAGHGIEQRFLHLKRNADGGKQFLRQFAVRRGRGFAERERRSARADERRRVGHDADDARARRQRGFQFCQRHAGGDGDEQMIAR